MTQQSNLDLRLDPADETIIVGRNRIRFLLTGEQTLGSVALLELTVPAGYALPAPAHSHDTYEETFYGLAGIITLTVNGQAIDVGLGQTLCIPRGATHSFVNHGATDAKSLITFSPALLGPAFFREMSAVIQSASDGPPDYARMAALMRHYGMTPAPPAAV